MKIILVVLIGITAFSFLTMIFDGYRLISYTQENWEKASREKQICEALPDIPLCASNEDAEEMRDFAKKRFSFTLAITFIAIIIAHFAL